MINNPTERQITGEEYKRFPRAGDQGAHNAGRGWNEAGEVLKAHLRRP